MGKKLHSILLASILLLALLPVTVMAADTTVAAGEDLQAAIDSASSGDTITVTGDITSGEPIAIGNKSVTIKGAGAAMPTIDALFEIQHTDGNGPYTVTFDGVRFAPDSSKEMNVITEKSKNATSADNVNRLVVQNCAFALTAKISGTAAVVSIMGTAQDGKTVTGAQLVFRNNTVKTGSFESGGTGYYNAVISTSATAGTVYAPDVYSFAKHEITGNTIQGNFYYGLVGGYADFTGNTVDLSYYDTNGQRNTATGRAFQVRGAKADNHGGQLDLTVTGNTFSNMKQFLKLYELDSLLTAENGYNLYIAGSEGAGANTFTDIPEMGEVESTAFAFGVHIYPEWQGMTWSGIETPKVNFVMADVSLTEEGGLTTGKMTLDDGRQVTTYTQATVAGGGERTGFYSEVDGEKYWYFASRADLPSLHYFVSDAGKFYITFLGGGDSTSALQSAGPEEAFPGYDAIKNDAAKKGTLYPADFTIRTDAFNNTYYNAEVGQEDDVVTLTGGDVKTINAYISGIGAYTALYVTDNADAVPPAGALKLVVPATSTAAMGQLLVSGSFPVIVDANVTNLDIVGKCDVNVAANRTIGKLEIDGAAAVGSTVVNRGSVGSAYLLARTDFINTATGVVTEKLAVGESRDGGLTRRTEACRLASGSVIRNEGKMEWTILYGQAELYNGKSIGDTASIQKLTVGNTGLLNEAGAPYATDSKIVNYGVMCDANGEGHDIYLYTRCTFDNFGTIGKEGRDHTGENGQECNNVGGMIYIGYYGNSDAHDGLVFNNEGTIHAGTRHNQAAHQVITFFLCGVKEDKGTDDVTIQINNTGEGSISGHVFTANYTNGHQINHNLGSLGENGALNGAITSMVFAADPASLTGGGTVTLSLTNPPDGVTFTVTCDQGVDVTENADGTYSALLMSPGTYTFTAKENGGARMVTAQVVVTAPSSGGSVYAVTVSESANGAVRASTLWASAGSAVTLTVTPDAGYVLDALTVRSAGGDDVAVTGKEDKYSFTMPAAAVTVSAVFKAEHSGLPFADVGIEDWFYAAVKYVYDAGLVNGVTETTFEPNSRLTRGTAVTILHRLAGEPAATGGAAFSDVDEGSWYADAIAWAAEQKIVEGYGDGTFRPDVNITREQMAAILRRYAANAGLDVSGTADLSDFPDGESVSGWAKEDMAWAVSKGLVTGRENAILDPIGTATRAEMATILMRYCETVAE